MDSIMRGPFKSYLGALWLQAKAADVFGMFYLFYRGLIYFIRYLRYEGLFPIKCPSCGAEVKVYFMRPREFIDGKESKNGVFSDWLICQNKDCLTACPL